MSGTAAPHADWIAMGEKSYNETGMGAPGPYGGIEYGSARRSLTYC